MSDQGTTYAEFIKRQADAELGRRERLDARGLAVVGTNAALATLVLGTLAILEGTNQLALTRAAQWSLAIALLCLVTAAFMGLLATQLRWYKATSTPTMQTMLGDPHWGHSEVTARNVCATTTLKTVTSLRQGNEKKASRIVLAVRLQLAAIVCLAGAAAFEVWGV